MSWNVEQRFVSKMHEERWLVVAGPCATQDQAERERIFHNRCGGRRGLGVAASELRVVPA